eukprot:136230-Pyramimonas_sp.AAC.1
MWAQWGVIAVSAQPSDALPGHAALTLLHYNPIAEQLDYRLVSSLESTMTRGMNTIKTNSHISSFVEGLPYASTISDSFACKNNLWVLESTKYRHGPHWPHARAL